jgi:Protein of unknown function (DUF559)
VREPSHRLTQHKRRGGRSLLVLWDLEEAPTLFFKGSKPGAATAGWSLFLRAFVAILSESFVTQRATRAPRPATIGPMTSSGAIERDESCIDHAIGGKCNPRDADLVLAELAGRQHGIVARWQLLAAGVGRRAIDERMGRRLHPIHRGVYAVGYQTRLIESRWMAAVLVGGPGAILSHRSAAQLWRLVARSSHLPEVTRPRHFRARPCICGHRSEVPDDERTLVEGIPVTTVPRTVLDLAAVAPRRQVERALNEVEVQGLTDRLSIPDLLARYPGRRGSAVLRALLDDDESARGITRSALEERFVALIDSYGLPRPRLNADLSVGGRFFSPDCLWMDERLIVELDGRAVHATRRAFEADRERDRLMLAEGWRVMRVTWRQLCDQESAVAADLRRALARGRELH